MMAKQLIPAMILGIVLPVALYAAPECITVRGAKQGTLLFGSVSVGDDSVRVVRIMNKCATASGNVSLGLSGIGFSTPLSGKVLVLPSRTRTSIAVTFAPNAVTDFAGNLSVYASKELGMALKGSGLLGVIPVEPPPVDPIPVDPGVVDPAIGDTSTTLTPEELALMEIPAEQLVLEGPTSLESCKRLNSHLLVEKKAGFNFDISGRRVPGVSW